MINKQLKILYNSLKFPNFKNGMIFQELILSIIKINIHIDLKESLVILLLSIENNN